ncbi:butyrophilin subfamily 1 member A1-like [Clarias gariepinus]|uniref:butyrophilin subfamily 1 member A1-like n=1 Tax=Clarias gariepinus TaxID=13013 RepID=UPI00234DFA9B|nr:butyrophilin subfamily 1 member A1-like [Clarias gariepinus]
MNGLVCSGKAESHAKNVFDISARWRRPSWVGQSPDDNMDAEAKVDVTLDPDTAYTAEGQKVPQGDTQQENLTDPPERFSDNHSVVGKQSFSSKIFYYEVQVVEKTGWTLGVVRENVNRKERLAWKPHYGFWTVSQLGNHYRANADTDVPLPLREKVEKVGVFVDYVEGLVSFYDVESRSHIYSFTGQSFNENLYAYLFTWKNDVQ